MGGEFMGKLPLVAVQRVLRQFRDLCERPRCSYDSSLWSRGNFQGKQMLRDAPIRTKLIAIFVLPALGTAVLAALRIAVDFRVGLRADREKLATVVALDAATLAYALGAERNASVAWLAGGRADSARPEVLTTRLRADRALRQFRRDTAGPGPSSRDPSLGSRLEAALAEVGRLAATRQSLERRPATVAGTISTYSTIIGHVLDVSARLPADVGHRGLARDLDALVALAQAEESASFERGLGTAVATAGRFQGRDYLRLAAAVGARQRELARFQATASGTQQRLYWSSVQAPRVDALRAVSQQLGAQALRTNRANVVAAEQQLLNNLLLFMIVVVLTFALAVLLARSMINPLIELEQAARDVAERRLPSVVERLHLAQAVDLEAETQPVEVRGGGEIGRVAEAFTAVQRVAVSVAVDQAALRQSVSEMFVNMARRSQSLIDRQLALIDQLEKNETDPDQLDQFFRLDHLATRMRRNAESLLVLSGSEPGRRWSQPVPLANLARAAVAEVEDYTRADPANGRGGAVRAGRHRHERHRPARRQRAPGQPAAGRSGPVADARVLRDRAAGAALRHQGAAAPLALRRGDRPGAAARADGRQPREDGAGGEAGAANSLRGQHPDPLRPIPQRPSRAAARAPGARPPPAAGPDGRQDGQDAER
jgi:hypothetical protein